MKVTPPEYRVGLDVGSTTAKIAVLDGGSNLVFTDYRRHNAAVKETLIAMFEGALAKLGDVQASVRVTGSAGIGVSERYGIPFVQEVVAAAEAVAKRHRSVRTLIDVGGEDSKMIFFDDRMRPDMRMNGNCAGGTGAFIDQMATLLNVPIAELEGLAQAHRDVHPIASRCGVFAKTDVQNLLAREISKDDIAASIFHAVAVQCIAALSRGHDPSPKVMFCGGPLTFLPSLRTAFIEALGISAADVEQPEHPELIPAIGTALSDEPPALDIGMDDLLGRLRSDAAGVVVKGQRMEPLFSSSTEREKWLSGRMSSVECHSSMGAMSGRRCFLGIDSGSTTTKLVLVDDDGRIGFRHYANNNGAPIDAVMDGLRKLAESAASEGVDIDIAGTAVTGYGEDLIKAAFSIDIGIVETLAHFRAAEEFLPDVSFILDIGGQDMKAIYIEDGVINNIEINEACSSGCGSFIETFANNLGFGVADFAQRACLSTEPSDLGTRCTVFMNSKVKQALREGASVEDISAGLAYSVIRNCLHKVLKVKDPGVLGDRVVVQGGTFRNPAVHRALEKVLGLRVTCPDIPELMGAYGAALAALDASGEADASAPPASSFIGLGSIARAKDYTKDFLRCRGCQNNCLVTKMTFAGRGVFFTGNKCERIFTNRGTEGMSGFNLPEYKLKLLFERSGEPSHADLPPTGRPLMTVGVPRALNIFENYPFWNALLRGCGIRVRLSSPSTNATYELGSRTIMSDNICYPAKLANGHLMELIRSGVDRLFLPIVRSESQEFGKSLNTFNCPVVFGYPDVLRSAVDPEGRFKVPFDTPTITFRNEGLLRRACWQYLSGLGVGRVAFDRAFPRALAAQKEYKDSVHAKAKEVLREAKERGRTVVVLLGRPYHVDPQINHKAPEMITALGADVITEDSLSWADDVDLSEVRVLTQWQYPNRVYHAAKVAREMDGVEIVQLNSFGCGPDALVLDESKEIVREMGKNFTLLKIDEVSSPGSMKLRLRSMMESLERRGFGTRIRPVPRKDTPPYTDKDRKRTIITPFFSPFHSPMVTSMFVSMGYDLVTLPPPDRASVDTGLKYSNHDICYPATIVIGDLIKALQSGAYDLDRVAVGITQTGGQCRASSYVPLLKKAMLAAGFDNVPVIAIALSIGRLELNHQPGFRINPVKLLRRGLAGLMYGDSIMQMYYSTAARERRRGDAKRVMDRYLAIVEEDLREGRVANLERHLENAVSEFNAVETADGEVPVVGFVGEIYVKYNPLGQLHITDWLVANGVEVVVPPMMDFFSQVVVNVRANVDGNLDEKYLEYAFSYPAEWYLRSMVGRYESIRSNFKYYRPQHDFVALSKMAEKVVHLEGQFGEGWLIPAEVSAFVKDGINNVVCVQPFGCIANHIIGKGVEKRLKDLYPDLNILNLDLDAGSSEVNVYNRLNFLVKSARDSVKAKGNGEGVAQRPRNGDAPTTA